MPPILSRLPIERKAAEHGLAAAIRLSFYHGEE